MPYPDIQYHFLPLAVTYDGSSLANEHGFQAHVGPMRTKSRGHVRLASRDARDKPKILFNYLSHPDDLVEFRACVRLTREIFAQPAFDPYRGREIQPGPDVQTDDEVDAFVRAKVETAYHPSCSNRMGSPGGPDGSRGSRGPRDRPGVSARDRFLDHAVDHDRQPECADDHAGGEACGRGARDRLAL